jgi:hypothetical protein
LTVEVGLFRWSDELILLGLRFGGSHGDLQLRVLLDHLATITDTGQSWQVAYPLREVMFLIVPSGVRDNCRRR